MTPETIRYEAVYPGHPITVGLAILWRYGNLTAAKEEALADSQIPGAGGCVRSALTVLEECWRGATIAEIQALAAEIWRHCDDQWIENPERHQKGQQQADEVFAAYLTALRRWGCMPREQR